MSICAHALIKNEERHLWYSVMSIVHHVDEVLLWDTGSTDECIEIEKELQKQFPDKIKLRFFKDIDKDEFTDLRQKMLNETKSDWVLLLDGDEVWWNDSILKIKTLIENRGDKIDSIVTPFVNLIGDIFHYQDEKAGKYKIDGKVGNLTIRTFRKNIPGLHFENSYGKEGLFYGDGLALQNGEKSRRVHSDLPFLHFTHLIRSANLKGDNEVLMRRGKYKYETGKMFPKDYYYPEVFFSPPPGIVKSPWRVAGKSFISRATMETPLRRIKRMF